MAATAVAQPDLPRPVWTSPLRGPESGLERDTTPPLAAVSYLLTGSHSISQRLDTSNQDLSWPFGFLWHHVPEPPHCEYTHRATGSSDHVSYSRVSPLFRTGISPNTKTPFFLQKLAQINTKEHLDLSLCPPLFLTRYTMSPYVLVFICKSPLSQSEELILHTCFILSSPCAMYLKVFLLKGGHSERDPNTLFLKKIISLIRSIS